MLLYLYLEENTKYCTGKSRLAYLVSDHENPGNHPIYAVEDDIGSSIFHISDDSFEPLEIDPWITK
jgi:hypothetical protein